MAAYGLTFPEFASVDSAGIWRWHANKRSVAAVKASRHCGTIVKIWRLEGHELILLDEYKEDTNG